MYLTLLSNATVGGGGGGRGWFTNQKVEYVLDLNSQIMIPARRDSIPM